MTQSPQSSAPAADSKLDPNTGLPPLSAPVYLSPWAPSNNDAQGSTPAANYAMAPLKLRNNPNLVEYFITLVATAACMGVLLFYLISGNSIFSGSSVSSRSLTYVLLTLGYITKGYSAMVSLAVIKCIKNGISDRLMESGVPVQVVADNIYNTDQGPMTLIRRLWYPFYTWPILAVFFVSLAIPGVSKASLQLTVVRYDARVLSSQFTDNIGCIQGHPQEHGCLTTPTGAFINATNVGLARNGTVVNPLSLNFFVPCDEASAAGTCYSTPIPLVVATGPTSNVMYSIHNEAAIFLVSSCYPVDYSMSDIASGNGGLIESGGTTYLTVIDNGPTSFLAAIDYTVGALLTVGMSIADGNYLCDVSFGICAADISWSGGVGEWQATGNCTGEALYVPQPFISPARVAILPAQLSDIFTLEATANLTSSAGTHTPYLLDVLGYAGKVAAALEAGYDYHALTQNTEIPTTVVAEVNAITVVNSYASVTVGLLGLNLMVLLLLVWNMRSLYMPLNFTQLICLAARVKDPENLLRFRTSGKPEYTGLVSIVLDDHEASLHVGAVESRLSKGQHQIKMRV